MQAFNAVRRASGQQVREVTTFPDLLEKSRMEIQRALPKHLESDRMMRLALTAFRTNEKLGECDPMSVIAAVVQASQMGLEIGLNGEAFLVPFKRECQLIPGYQGLMKLARQSGFVDDIFAMEVYERDIFEIDYGASRKLVHTPHKQSNGFPAARSARGELMGFYAVAMLTNGNANFVHLALDDCLAIRDSSSGYKYAVSNRRSHPWITDFTEMGKKSVIRMLTKQLPKSPHLSIALHLDSLSNEGLKQRITLEQAADGTYEPSQKHFDEARGDDEKRGRDQEVPAPAGRERPSGPAPSDRTREQGQRSAGARAEMPAQSGHAAGSPGSSKEAPVAARRITPAPRPAGASAPTPLRQPVAAREPRAPEKMQVPSTPKSNDAQSLSAAEPFLKQMRSAPTMDRVNDIYINAQDTLGGGAGMASVDQEYMNLKTKLSAGQTRPMFS